MCTSLTCLSMERWSTHAPCHKALTMRRLLSSWKESIKSRQRNHKESQLMSPQRTKHLEAQSSLAWPRRAQLSDLFSMSKEHTTSSCRSKQEHQGSKTSCRTVRPQRHPQGLKWKYLSSQSTLKWQVRNLMGNSVASWWMRVLMQRSR